VVNVKRARGMRVAFVFPGLSTRSGGGMLAGISQARAVGLLHEVHALVLGEPDATLLAGLGHQLPGAVHHVPGLPGTIDRRLRQLFHEIRADVVQVESLRGAEWISDPRTLGIPTIYRAYDATFSVMADAIRSPVNMPVSSLGFALNSVGLRRPLLRLANARFQRREMGLARRFDRVLCFSAADREIFDKHRIAAAVVPLPMDASPEPHRPTTAAVFRIAFIGTFSYFPNVDALAYLLAEIVPALASDPNWRLDVIGAEPPAISRKLLSADRVRIHGYVEDLQTLLNSVDAVVVPLRFGGGVKLKTMTALARGIPIVTSSEGCTGLSVRDGEEALIRDTAGGFAEALRILARDPSLRRRLGEGGRRLIATEHAPLLVAQALHAEYKVVIASGRDAGG
jgi:glycosyltransferase involved in cell wall biosynthesis